jgi:hypothetical protein
LQNVVLVQSSRDELERWHAAVMARDLAPMMSAEGSFDAGQQVVGPQYVAVLERLLESAGLADVDAR